MDVVFFDGDFDVLPIWINLENLLELDTEILSNTGDQDILPAPCDPDDIILGLVYLSVLIFGSPPPYPINTVNSK